MTITMVATCLFGLEKLLGEEIDALGLKRLDTMDGRVTFEGTPRDVARANIQLRFAERVFIKMGSFSATTFTELFDGTYNLPWEEWIGLTDSFPVSGHSPKSLLHSIPDCQSIVKKAIAKRLSDKYGVSWLEETGVKYAVEFFIFKDVATLMIDTSGDPLHKRGYRPTAGMAPLRETLAAALAQLAHPKEDVLLWDPFCGSGTIAIEHAMILSNIAPGMRRHFTGEQFVNLPENIWNEAKEEAQSGIRQSDYRVYASDIDRGILSVAKANAERAGVLSHIRFFEADARKIQKENCRGTILCNPPYGERMMTPKEAEQLYTAIGKNFVNFLPWQIYILTSCETFERHFWPEHRADKIRKLYNGMIPCFLYEYFKPKIMTDHKEKRYASPQK